MTRIFLILSLLGLIAPPALAAKPHRAQFHFSAFVAGLNIINLRAGLDVGADTYRVELAYRSAGMFGTMMRARFTSIGEGRFEGLRVIPLRFENQGRWRGAERHILIDYPDGQPKVITLVPQVDVAREPIPPEMSRDTVDGFSLIASLVRNVSQTGGCDGVLTFYDARRALRVTSRTIGREILPRETRSIFQGEALRCDFESVIIGGFEKDSEPGDGSRRPQAGSVWIAKILPDMPALPVLMSLETRLAGHVNIYVTKAVPGWPVALEDDVE